MPTVIHISGRQYFSSVALSKLKKRILIVDYKDKFLNEILEKIAEQIIVTVPPIEGNTFALEICLKEGKYISLFELLHLQFTIQIL